MFYDQSIAAELKTADNVEKLEQEIKEQMQAVMAINGLQKNSTIDDFTISNAVKTAIVGSDIIIELGRASDVVMRKIHVNTEDIYKSRFLEYAWKVPVLETEDSYLYSTVIIRSAEDVVVSSTIAPKNEMNDVSYLFDKDLVVNILKNSGLNVEYDIVLPVSIPTLSTDFIVFSADNLQYVIPFSARPDLLEIENGEIYPYKTIEEKIGTWMNGIMTEEIGLSESAGGGIGQMTSGSITSENMEDPFFLWAFGLVILIVCAGGLFVYHKSRRIHTK